MEENTPTVSARNRIELRGIADVSATEYLRRRRIGVLDDASHFLLPAMELEPRGRFSCAWLLCRASTDEQEYRLPITRDFGLKKLRQHGYEVVGDNRFDKVETSYHHDETRRPNLYAAARMAKKLGAILVTADRDRLFRPGDFHHCKNTNGCPTFEEYRCLLENLDVTIATIVPPDATLKQIRHNESNIIRLPNANRGGRPKKTPEETRVPVKTSGYKKEIRDKERPIARAKREEGKTIRQIADELGRKKSTISDWCNGPE